MSALRTFVSKVLALFGVRHRDDDVAEEIQSHIDSLADTLGRDGLSRDEALAAARRTFGGVEQVKERYRDQRGFPFLDALRQDGHYAIRQLGRSPGFAAGATLSLAAGIGFSIAVFTAIDALLLNPYAFKDVERMMMPRVLTKSGGGGGIEWYLTGAQFDRLRAADVVDDAIAIDGFPMRAVIDGTPLYVVGSRVSINTFEYWGVAPLFGRTFTRADAPNGRPPNRVAVLTYRYWQSQFGGDRGALGRSVRFDDNIYEIVGVMPPGFLGSYYGTEVYIPTERLNGSSYPHAVHVRLKPGISREAGAAALQALFAQFEQESPRQGTRDTRLVLNTIDNGLKERFGSTLRMLVAAGALLLLVGCANVAILFLAREAKRRDELTVRRALGAAPWRVVAQLLTEASILALMGTLGGLLLARVGVPLIRHLAPDTFFPPETELRINMAALGFAVVTAVVSTLLFGLWPAIRSMVLADPSLRVTRQSATHSVRHQHTYNLLIAGQIAVTTVIVAAAGASLRDFLALIQTPLGYEPTRVLRANVALPEGYLPQREERVAYYERIRARIADMPSIGSVSVGMGGALVPPNTGYPRPIAISGRAPVASDRAALHLVDAQHAAALGLSIRQGRWWADSDTARATPVAVINEAMAARYWPGKNPVGDRVRLPTLTTTNTWDLATVHAADWLEVIGVLRNTPNKGLRELPQPAIYAPYMLFVQDVVGFVIRTDGSPDAAVPLVRKAVDSAAPGTPIVTKSAMTLLEDVGWGRERFLSTIFMTVAAIALLIGATGIFSVIAYVVSQRTRELGIRAALGAGRSTLILTVLSSTIGTVTAGLVAGVVMAVGLNDSVKQLSGITISHAGVLGLAVATLLGVAAVAALLPTRRAAAVNPLIALRSE